MEENKIYYQPANNVFFNHTTKYNVSAFDFRPHSHAVCELILFKKGKMTYTIGGRNYRLRKDDLVITRPTEIHGLIPTNGTNYERYNILFNEKTLPFDVFKKIPQKTDVINVGHNHIIMEIFEKMDYYESCLSGIQLNMILINMCQEILVNVLLEITSKNKSQEYTLTNQIVADAISYIDDNLLDINNVKEISEQLFVTKSHLHHLFIKHLNISPKKYILSKKLVLAQREILSGKNPTKLYDKYGFNDYSSFYRAYKNHIGTSPSQSSASQIIITDDNIL